MKRFFLLFALSFFAWVSQAKEVTAQQAGELAVQYIRKYSSRNVAVKSIQAMGKEKRAFYVVNLAPQGWVIVASDDVIRPVIGYSFTGDLDVKKLPDNMQYALGCHEREMLRIVGKVQEAHPYWKSSGHIATRAAGRVIEPLISVNWNQDSPYNAYCPKRGDKHALVGCVAVAMGQAMSAQRYPVRPKGKVSYAAVNYGGLKMNFDNERAYNWTDILEGSNNQDEAARLLYHAGMSVFMDYGEEGSGIPSNEVNRISNALKSNFSYPDEVYYVWKDDYDGDWNQLLINELSAGRVIIYNAVDDKNRAGHSFNLDGYDGEGHFHVNWGWGGYGNAYFSINNLRDSAMNMDYDIGHVAILGIGAADQLLKSISLSSNQIEEGLPAGSVVGQVYVNEEAIPSSYVATVSGVNDKEVPFRIENSLLKTTEILSSDNKSWEIEITIADRESDASLTQGFRVTVNPWKSLSETTSVRFERTSRTFTFTTKHNVSYTIRDEQGRLLQSGKLEPLPRLVVGAASLPEGVCVLELKCANETKLIQLKNK